MVVDETREVPIQVNGKLRDRVTVPAGISEVELEQVVLARDKVRRRAGRQGAAEGRPRRRRPAREHRRPGRTRECPTSSGSARRAPGADDFETLLQPHTPAVAETARALRLVLAAAFPDAVEQVDFGNKLIAFGKSMAMRGPDCSRSSPTRPTSTSSSPTASICPIPTA